MAGTDVGAGVGGIGQSFLVSNRLSKVDPALGQEVPCLTGALGMSSKGGGFWTDNMMLEQEASENWPVASLCTVTGMAIVANLVVCIWVDVVMVVRVVVEGTGWFRTLAL